MKNIEMPTLEELQEMAAVDIRTIDKSTLVELDDVEIHEELPQAERIAVNSPIQGSAADMIKVAMIKIHHAIKKAKLRSTMLLQVHDELVFDVHETEVEQLKKLVVDNMVNAITINVPIEAEVGIGDNWLEAH